MPETPRPFDPTALRTVIAQETADMEAFAASIHASGADPNLFPYVEYRLVTPFADIPVDLRVAIVEAGEPYLALSTSKYGSVAVLPFSGYAQVALTVNAFQSVGCVVASAMVRLAPDRCPYSVPLQNLIGYAVKKRIGAAVWEQGEFVVPAPTPDSVPE